MNYPDPYIAAVSVIEKKSGTLPYMFFTPTQTKELISIGMAAYIVMEHYVALAIDPDYIEGDEDPYRNSYIPSGEFAKPQHNLEHRHISHLTGLSYVQIQRAHEALVKAGWFEVVETAAKPNGSVHQVSYFVGKHNHKRNEVRSSVLMDFKS